MVHGVNGRMRHESPWVDSAASQAAERKSQYYSLLYKEIAERKRAEENLRQSNALLMALGAGHLGLVPAWVWAQCCMTCSSRCSRSRGAAAA